MKTNGVCHCGQIMFEAEIDPSAMLICHCTGRQALTGPAYRAVISASAANFVLRTGPSESCVKTAESGNKRRHAFRANCGTPIYACAVDNPQRYTLRVVTITQRSAFSPQRQIWRRSAQIWVDTLAAMPATEEGFGGH